MSRINHASLSSQAYTDLIQASGRALHLVELPPQRAFSFPARPTWKLRPEPVQLELKLDGAEESSRRSGAGRFARVSGGGLASAGLSSPAIIGGYPQLAAAFAEEDRAEAIERKRQTAHLKSLRGYKAQRAYLIERAEAGDGALFSCGRNFRRVPESLVTALCRASLSRGAEPERLIRAARPKCLFCELPAFVKPDAGGVFHCLFERCLDRDLHEIARAIVAGEARLA